MAAVEMELAGTLTAPAATVNPLLAVTRPVDVKVPAEVTAPVKAGAAKLVLFDEGNGLSKLR